MRFIEMNEDYWLRQIRGRDWNRAIISPQHAAEYRPAEARVSRKIYGFRICWRAQ